MSSGPPAEQQEGLERRRQGLTILSATGLLLASAALISPSEPASVENAARRFIIDLPDWLNVAIVVLLSGVALLVLALIAPRPRRRKKDEEPYEMYYEPPKLTFGIVVFLLLLGLSPLGLVGATLWFSHTQTASLEAPGIAPRQDEAAAPSAAPSGEAVEHPEPLPLHSAAASGILGTLALLAAVAAVGVVLWLYFGDWLLRSQAARLRTAPLGFHAAVDESLEDVRLEPDPRKAIIMCYRRFERVLASCDFPRPPWQTALEFMGSVLRWLHLPSDAVQELTRLFEISRFSHHALSAGDRDAAWRALETIKAELDRREANAPTS